MSASDDFVFRNDVIEHGLDREHLVHTDGSGVRLDSCGPSGCSCHCAPKAAAVARADVTDAPDPQRHANIVAIRKHPNWVHFDGKGKSDHYVETLARTLAIPATAKDEPRTDAEDPAEAARLAMIERGRTAYITANEDPSARVSAAADYVLSERRRRAHEASVRALRAGRVSARTDDDDDGPKAA